jgi:hypothetical protein
VTMIRSSRGLKNINFDENTFVFRVNGQQFQVSKFAAHFISPAVSRSLPTVAAAAPQQRPSLRPELFKQCRKFLGDLRIQSRGGQCGNFRAAVGGGFAGALGGGATAGRTVSLFVAAETASNSEARRARSESTHPSVVKSSDCNPGICRSC